MKKSIETLQSKLGETNPQGALIVSPLQNKSTADKEIPKVRRKPRTRSQLRKLKTEDFSMRRKMMNLGAFGKLQVLLKGVQQYIYILLEDPSSSLLACSIQYSLMISILMSCAAIITDSIVDQTNQDYQDFSQYLELYLFIFFGTEYFLRLVSCTSFGNRLFNFIFSPMNIIDLVAILPFLLNLTMESTSIQQLRVIRIVRFLRVFRIFKISRYIKDMMLLAETVKNSIKDILILLAILGVFVLFFSTIIYYAESNSIDDQNDDVAILSISDAIWWCITTMTTVGYGDKVPVTVQGKFIACITAFFGITSISLPVAVMGMNLTQTLRNHEENQEIQNLKIELAKKTDSEKSVPMGSRYESDKNLNEKELQFMVERLKQLLDNNERIFDYVERSQLLFDQVTTDLMSLYTALAEEMDLHLEEKLKNLKARHKIMKMEKNMNQKKQIEVNQIVTVYREKQRMMSQMSQLSALNCEESQPEGSVYSRKAEGSVYSRKASVKNSVISKNRGRRTQLYNKFPYSSQQEMQQSLQALEQKSEYGKSRDNSIGLQGKQPSISIHNDGSMLDNFGNKVNFQFDLRQSSGEIEDDDDQCDLNGKMRSLSVASEKLQKMNSNRFQTHQ